MAEPWVCKSCGWVNGYQPGWPAPDKCQNCSTNMRELRNVAYICDGFQPRAVDKRGRFVQAGQSDDAQTHEHRSHSARGR